MDEKSFDKNDKSMQLNMKTPISQFNENSPVALNGIHNESFYSIASQKNNNNLSFMKTGHNFNSLPAQYDSNQNQQ